MDSLCEMLAEKLGIVADASSSWLQTAIAQYSQMMAIRTTFGAVLSLVLFVASVAVLFLGWRNADDSDAIVVAIIAFVFIALTACCLAVAYVPDAICWHVTPDAMLIKELTEVLE